MFKYFALVCALFITSPLAAEEPLLTRQFELNKPFCAVIASVLRDEHVIREKMGMKLVGDQKFDSATLVVSYDGWTLIVVRRVVAHMRGAGDTNLVETIQITQHSVSIEEKLDGDSDYFREFKAIFELVEQDDKTQVRANYWVNLNRATPRFLLRGRIYGNAKRFEQAMRESVGLPKEVK